MAQSLSQKRSKNTLALKRLASFSLILIFIVGGSFLFFVKQEDLDKSEQKKLEIQNLINYQQIIENNYQWEIITQDNLKIIIDPNQDIKKQINLVKQALLEIKPTEYIGIDVKGQIYYK